MTTVVLGINQTSRSGLADPAGDAVVQADDATFVSGGDVVLRVVWGGIGGTLAVTTPATVGSNPSHAVADDAISFNASDVKWLGPYPGGIYNSAGLVAVDPDQDCTITAFKHGALS